MYDSPEDARLPTPPIFSWREVWIGVVLMIIYTAVCWFFWVRPSKLVYPENPPMPHGKIAPSVNSNSHKLGYDPKEFSEVSDEDSEYIENKSDEEIEKPAPTDEPPQFSIR